MRRLFIALLPLALAACAMPPVTGVTRMGDGVLQAPTLRAAEVYCANAGDPFRLVGKPDPQGTGPVMFRCD